jgi:hypothetical protein
MMKKIFLLLAVVGLFAFDAQAQVQYKVITVIESIVPAGLGRSRIIQEQQDINSGDFTTARTDGKSSNQDEVRRKDLKVDAFEETKLLNFFSLGGINFQNVASNDAIISDKLNQLTADGWELAFVNSGVESSCGGDDGEGIFITRYVFKR